MSPYDGVPLSLSFFLLSSAGKGEPVKKKHGGRNMVALLLCLSIPRLLFLP
jgi:hypothetical protein